MSDFHFQPVWLSGFSLAERIQVFGAEGGSDEGSEGSSDEGSEGSSVKVPMKVLK